MNKLILPVALALLAPAAIAQCGQPGPGAVSYGDGDDFIANAGTGIDMGFAFQMGAASYQFIHPSSNGFCYLSDGTPVYTDSDYTPAEADMAAGAPRVAVLWDDLTLLAGVGELWVDTSVGGQCTVTWADVVLYGQTTTFWMQCTLFSSGQVDFSFSQDAYQTTESIVGISPGNGIVQPPSFDLSSQAPSASDMTHELFPGGSLDLVGQLLTLIPTSPGYVPVLGSPGCATSEAYGTGCISVPDARYELFSATAGGATVPDIMASGTTITFLRTGAEYTVLDSIPGTYLAPSANAVPVTAQDDAFGVVALSQPMPVPGGVTNNLQVASNGYIHLTDNAPAGTADYSPSEAEFEAFVDPTICGPWYDWSPNQAGQIVAEEVNGVVYVTWDGVQPYNGTGTDTFQFQFELASGNCTIVFDNMSFSGNFAWHEVLFGLTPGTAVAAESTDWSAELPNTVRIGDVGSDPLKLESTSGPTIAGTWDLTTTNIDPVSPVAITFFGTPAQAPLPLSAIGFTAPGCDLLLGSVSSALQALASGGSATLSLQIPINPNLAGQSVAAQSLCLTLLNPGNVLVSNGVLGTVGN